MIEKVSLQYIWPGGVSQVSVTVKLYNKSQHGGREEEGGAIKHDKQPQCPVL